MAADGSIVIETKLDNRGFNKGVDSMHKKVGGLTSVVKKLGTAVASAFAVRALVNFGKECVELGSNVAEVQNVVDTAFGDMTYKVEAFADTAIQNFGMSRLAAKKTASTYMAMAKGMGVADEAASDMAITLAGLSGDVASFYNISQELADTKLKSVFTGETETLKDLGVVMTQDNLKAYALAQGITKSYDAMTQAEKVALRYNYVLDSLSLAQGDFAKTSGSWANQTRILSMQWEEFMSIIGQALITVLTPCVKVLNQIVSSLISVANTINTVVSSIFGGSNTQIQKTADTASSVGAAIETSVEAQERLTDATEETAKAQKGVLAGFDEINKLSSGSESTSSGVAGTSISTSDATGFATEIQEIENSRILTFFENLRGAIQPTVDALSLLWDELKRVAGFAGGALIDFYNGFLAPVGSWVLGEGLPRLVDAISNGLSNINFTTISEALGRVWDALAPFAINVGEGLLWFYEAVLVPLGVWVMNEAVPRFLDLIAAAFNGINTVWATVQPALQWLWDNFLVPIGSYVVNEVVPAFFEGLDGALQAISAIWADVQPALQWLWDNFLQPVAEWTGGVILDVLSSLSDELKRFGDWCKDNYKAIEDIALVVGGFAAAWVLVNGAVTLWETIGTIGTAVTTAFGAAVNFLTSPITIVTLAIGALIAIIVLLVRHWDEVKEAASKAWEWIKDVWEGVAEWFDEKIIDPITRGFKNFINGLIGGVESFVNFFIRGINKVIGALNKLSFDVPDWVPGIGGKTFGFNVSQISEISLPRLAEGAVIPPNREFLAVLGDQKSGTNIEAPLSTIEQAVENVWNRRGNSESVTKVALYLDGREIARNQIKHINDMTRERGKPVLLF